MQFADDKEEIRDQLRLAHMIRRGIGSVVMLFIALILSLLARNTDWFADWYSGTIYRFLVSTVGRFTSLFPFSVVEILLYITVITATVRFIWFLVSAIRKRDKLKVRLLAGVIGTAHFISGLLLIYTLACGINYQRAPFSQVSGLKVQEYGTEELKAVCEKLTGDVNRLARKVDRNKKGLATAGSSLNENAREAMKSLGRKYSSVSGYYPRPKGLLVSPILSWQQLTGVYSPFTIEANYNSDMLPYNIPFTVCHELSHLRGFMREDEANFIAYLACMESDNTEFQYSGSLLGWIYCMNVLYDADRDAYTQIRNTLDPLVKADLKANSQFWDRYEGKAAELSDKMNDTYLKANDQEDGIKSYDRMVDLLVSYQINRGIMEE